jgi:hypothetical protein
MSVTRTTNDTGDAAQLPRPASPAALPTPRRRWQAPALQRLSVVDTTLMPKGMAGLDIDMEDS